MGREHQHLATWPRHATQRNAAHGMTRAHGMSLTYMGHSGVVDGRQGIITRAGLSGLVSRRDTCRESEMNAKASPVPGCQAARLLRTGSLAYVGG
jgi:hypothetical protein